MNTVIKEPALILLEPSAVERTIRRMAHEIAEKAPDLNNLVLVGIEGAGLDIAQRIATEILNTFRTTVSVFCWNRDGSLFNPPNFSTKVAVIVDDVIFSGSTLLRLLGTVPGIMDAKELIVAALVDRGHRRFPVYAGVIGLTAPTKLDEHIDVVYGPDGGRVVLFK